MSTSNGKRRVLFAVTAGALGSIMSLGLLTAPAQAAQPLATAAAADEPEIEAAETTDVVPSAARSGDLLRVRDAATGQESFYKVVETRDLGSIGTETLKGAASGAVSAAGIFRVLGDDSGAAILKVPAAAVGGLFGGLGGLATGGYDVIFNSDKDVVLVKGDEFVDTAVNAGQVWPLQGTFVQGVGVVPLDQSFQP